MRSTPHILIVSPDPALRDEVETALTALDGSQTAIQAATDVRQGLESARRRTPGLALVEMGPDLRELKLFASELEEHSPGTTVAGVFRPDSFGADVSEAAVLIEALRAGVKDFLRRPVAANELADLLRRSAGAEPRAASAHGRVVSFISNKGGVGKSTLAVNAACGVARRHPGRVLLVDASLQLGVCASLLDLAPTATLTDAARERDRLDETLLRQLATPHHCGLHLLAAPPDAVEASEVDDELLARVLTLARRAYDYVVVDTFPLFDRVVMAALDLTDRAYIVSENVVPTLLGAVKLLKLLDRLEFPRERRRIVLNRFTSAAGSLRSAEVAARLGADVDFVLPFDKRVVVAANTGVPVILESNRLFGYGRKLRGLIDDVESTGPAGAHVTNGRHPAATFSSSAETIS